MQKNPAYLKLLFIDLPNLEIFHQYKFNLIQINIFKSYNMKLFFGKKQIKIFDCQKFELELHCLKDISCLEFHQGVIVFGDREGSIGFMQDYEVKQARKYHEGRVTKLAFYQNHFVSAG